MPTEYRTALSQAVNALVQRTVDDYVRQGHPRRTAERLAEDACAVHVAALHWVLVYA